MDIMTPAQLTNLATFLDSLAALSEKHRIWIAEFQSTYARMDKDGDEIVEISRLPGVNETRPEYVFKLPIGG